MHWISLANMYGERLRAFVAVAREGGFKKAALTMHKTQPAISQAVASLERELGQPLFVRAGRKTRLTAAGSILLEHAEEATASLDRGRSRLSALLGLEEGRLVIGTSDTTATHLLPPVLAAFRARHPAIELGLVNAPTPALAEAVGSREADLAIATLPLSRDLERRLRVQSVALMDREDVLICAPTHALAGRKRVRIEELEGPPLLLLHRGTGSRSLLDAAFTRAGIEPTVAMEMGSVGVLARLVELDFGVSIVPRYAVEAHLDTGTLHAATLTPRTAHAQIGLVVPADGTPSPAAQAFIALCRERLTTP